MTRVPLSPATIAAARVALRGSIKAGLKARHNLPETWRANIRQDIRALRELKNVRGQIDLPTVRRHARN